MTKENYTKENPLEIESLDCLKFGNTFLRHNFASFKCCVCGKKKVSKMLTLISHKKLICHQCVIKQSIIEKYGSKEEYYKKVAQTYKNTCKEKYGVENMFQLENVKQKIKQKQQENDPFYEKRNEKTRKTCQDRYGTNNGGCSKQALEKIALTKKERYGDPFYTNREKSAETFKSNHSTKESLQELSKKRWDTIIEKYGSKEEYFKHSTEKAKSTPLQKYGVEHHNQLPERRMLGFSPFRYYFDDYVFDSSWELAYYIWLKDQDIDFVVHPYPIEYFDEFLKKNRKYFPDFIVEDEYIEIKGDFLMDDDGSLKDIGKQKLLEDYEVALITKDEIQPYIEYAMSKVGDLKNFRKKKSFRKV